MFTRSLLAASLLLAAPMAHAQDPGPIIHDGEYNFLFAQKGDEWTAQDAEIDARLAEIRAANGGKAPNILYVLIDDVSFGLLGNRAMNYVTGIDTPNINNLASEGMSLMRMYTEPSCTPTRTAMLTGRHPVRAGVEEVKVALVGEGLSAEEVTIAEVLKNAGYNTAHVGKWHQGDIEEAFPHNQGFDWAAFPAHQQVQLSLMTREAMEANNMVGLDPSGQTNPFAIDERFKPYGLVTGLEAEAGGMAREVGMEAGEIWTQAHYREMNDRYQRQAIEQLNRLAAEDAPFFLQYWPLYPLNFVYDQEQQTSRNGGYMAEKLELLDGWLGELFAEVDRLGIAENTLVVLMADNGIFNYYAPAQSGFMELIYRGGKTQHLEGGVRVDAFARWPGVIEAGSAAGDIVHVSDLFTTFARIGDATDFIPRDRVIDGVDQTALLLEGEGNSRRDYVYIYEGPVLRSVVKQEFKMHLPAPGLPGAAAPVFNVLRDPREESSQIGIALWSGASFQDMLKRHALTIKKHPHLPLGTDVPYSGIENLRPESELARQVFSSWQ
ncbi:sulfatase-like hydrolase/transferase [Meridianimarinicoccus sp. MJW13]|uniref:sulfatase-like hydrolase/transferase n=1 Tax=Meridianimarinicoccus sp. MJW13 TaxID=2720031 RepID=UPI0018679738|nr:sulfatase-like hydrolase/transferase [Fluviibacterium sp. MJW13]